MPSFALENYATYFANSSLFIPTLWSILVATAVVSVIADSKLTPLVVVLTNVGVVVEPMDRVGVPWWDVPSIKIPVPALPLVKMDVVRIAAKVDAVLPCVKIGWTFCIRGYNCPDTTFSIYETNFVLAPVSEFYLSTYN